VREHFRALVDYEIWRRGLRNKTNQKSQIIVKTSRKKESSAIDPRKFSTKAPFVPENSPPIPKPLGR
jgi:hypothetical protein